MTADRSTATQSAVDDWQHNRDAPFARELSRGRQTSKDAVASSDCPNVLARGTEFSGTIEVADSIRLEGKFKGEVWTLGTLHVVPEATVQAKVQATFAVIGGRFKGSIACEQRVDLLADCRAAGTLTTAALTVEEGAVFDGDVAMTKRAIAAERDRSLPQ